MMKVGELAPDFTLESTKGLFSLSAYRNQKSVVIIFYPEDDTPG